MLQMFTSWLVRRKIHAHVRLSGRPVEHRHLVNPYHAVSIETGSNYCEQARELDGQRFLAAAAPELPLRECGGATACACRYIHHNDRRSTQRRVQPHNPYGHKMNERRAGGGRRIND